MNILLTGATGFLGQRLAFKIESIPDFNLTSVVRSEARSVTGKRVFISQIDGDADCRPALINQDLIIHTAAIAHVMKQSISDTFKEYRSVNVHGTLNLARQAVASGVKRFVFISSIKVNGEHTLLGQPFRAESAPAPEDHTGISKYEAEQGLFQIAEDTGLEVVIIRSPLVYGPGVKGNFASISNLVEKGFPLPFGAIHNQRSFVALDNLVDLIITCIDHPAAAHQVFLAGDGEDLSTTELLRGIAKATGVSSRLIPVPAAFLIFVASLLGKKTIAQRLLGSLQVDISKARDLLGWTPPLSVEEGLRRCFVRNVESY